MKFTQHFSGFKNTKSLSTHILNSPRATRSDTSWGRGFSSIPRRDSPRCTAAQRVPRCTTGPSNAAVDLPALGAHTRELRLPLTLSQIWRGQKGAGREQEPSREAWRERVEGACYLQRFSRYPSSPGVNPAQRCVLPQLQTFARSSWWPQRRRWRLLEPGPVACSVGARGCGGCSLRAARSSPQPAGARAPHSPRSLLPFSFTEPRHRLPPSSATSASRARACHFLLAPAAAAPAPSAPPPPPLRLG